MRYQYLLSVHLATQSSANPNHSYVTWMIVYFKLGPPYSLHLTAYSNSADVQNDLYTCKLVLTVFPVHTVGAETLATCTVHTSHYILLLKAF